jgi:hypothetical protein
MRLKKVVPVNAKSVSLLTASAAVVIAGAVGFFAGKTMTERKIIARLEALEKNQRSNETDL